MLHRFHTTTASNNGIPPPPSFSARPPPLSPVPPPSLPCHETPTSPKLSPLGSIYPPTAILANKTSIPVLYPFVFFNAHVAFENRCSKLNDADPNAIGRREWRQPWLPPCRYVETAPNAWVRLEWRPPWTCIPSLRTRTFFRVRVLIRSMTKPTPRSPLLINRPKRVIHRPAKYQD